uniref:Uncharacterized protein n=1 Tax=Opuntia streptacantha TaxID=393608 RepID=A0A7C9CMM2_OPUST
MNKPLDPYLLAPKPAGHHRLPLSSSSSSDEFSCFMSRSLNFTNASHHYLATCKDLPLIGRIWKRYWSYPFNLTVMMKIIEELVFFMSRSGGFTLIALPEITSSHIWVRVSKSFLGGHLRADLLTTEVPRFTIRGCVISPSSSINGKRWIWSLIGRSWCIQGLLLWLQTPEAEEGELYANGG